MIADAVAKLILPTERDVWAFCLQVPIATKDYGVIPIQGWGTQRHLVRAILAGKAKGINQFVVVKARQVGASTILLLLTLMWMWRFPGLQGLTVTDGEENKQYFRDLFLTMVADLEARQDAGDAPSFEESATDPSRTRARNQVQITWGNQSRLLLQMAGARTWRRLGVGRGLSFLHGTEVGLWSGGGKAVTYLRSAFSEVNPAALYIFEGTARGKNWYYDFWTSALKAQTIQAIFLGWWLREDNILRKSQKKLFAAYWDGHLTAKEREWDKVLRRRDKVVLTPEQWAWRRWYVAEKAGGSHRIADQEMPTVWEDAFSASQERPFLDAILEKRLETAIAAPTEGHQYAWGTNLEDTALAPPPARVRPMLRVWTLPDHRPVVIAAVPAHSIVENDPTWVVSVWAADLDRERLEQVAEFASDLAIGLQPFAWTCLHLAGSYGVDHQAFILEITGLGMGVLAEIKRLVYSGWGTARAPHFRHLLGAVHHYIWRRPDAIAGVGAYQWKSTPELQATLLHRLRDQLTRGVAILRSDACLEELDRLEGSGEGFTPAGDEPRAHRAYAAALAMESYSGQLYPQLSKFRPEHGARSVQERTVARFLAGLGGR
jgi:hypothetical protein